MAIVATVRSYRTRGLPENEDPRVESRIYAPAGIVLTPAEKELEAQWKALPPDRQPLRARH